MPKERNLIIALVILPFLLLLGIIIFFTNDLIYETDIFKIVSGIFNIILTGTWIEFFLRYLKMKRLKLALSYEMGFIARAVFYVLSHEKIKVKELKETFTVTNAILHTVGADIAILDKETSNNFLEFHSLMKVVINTLALSNQEKIKYLNDLFFKLADVLQKNSTALEIVNESSHAKTGLQRSQARMINLEYE